jgi:hypothetical protein
LCRTRPSSFRGTSPIPLSFLGASTYGAGPTMSFPDLEELALTGSKKCARLLSRLEIPHTRVFISEHAILAAT